MRIKGNVYRYAMKYTHEMRRTLVLCIAVLTSSYGLVRAKECHTKTKCSCKFDEGGVIDISSLGNNDNIPKFKDQKAAGDQGNLYSYNPCYPFTEGQCKNAASCILSEDRKQQVSIGDASSAAFKYDPDSGHVIVAYSSGSPTQLRVTEVTLVCDPDVKDPEFTANGQVKGGSFGMTLKHKCACPDVCSSSSSSKSGGLSGGSVLCIVFFTVLIVYVVGGIVFMKFVRKQEGTDILPNKNLWVAIPGLIKSGFLFTFGKVFVRFRKPTYDTI